MSGTTKGKIKNEKGGGYSLYWNIPKIYLKEKGICFKWIEDEGAVGTFSILAVTSFRIYH